ncbi:MAG: YdcF family protein [Acidobacteria bacterium]|nr:YdcF family protein [Acidobacteriota bacterium]
MTIAAEVRPALMSACATLLGYLAPSDPPAASDIIWGLGSHEPRVAERAADLFHGGFAPLIVFSGGKGHRWSHLPRSEAELFAEIAAARGVPADRMVLETRSTNTAENILLSSDLFRERGLHVATALLVTIPPFQRRASLTVRTHRPDIQCLNCPSDWGSPDEWDDETLALVARLCAGEIQRLRTYPARGFLCADPQPIPAEAIRAASAIEAHLPAF